MRLLLIVFVAMVLSLATVSFASRSIRIDNFHHHHQNTLTEKERRNTLDYNDIETADQDQVELFNGSIPPPGERSLNNLNPNRVGGSYSTVHNSIQVSKSGKSGGGGQRRSRKLSASASSQKDSEASGTYLEGTPYGAGLGQYASGPLHSINSIQQIRAHDLLTSQGLVPIHHYNQVPTGSASSNSIILAAGGFGGVLQEHGYGLGHQAQHNSPLIVTGVGGAPPPSQIIAAGGAAGVGVAPVPHILEASPDNELGADISKPVYVFSAAPQPLPPPHLKPQKHYQVLFINSPHHSAPPQPHPHHHVELQSHPPSVVYVLARKPHQAALPPLNFIKAPIGLHQSHFHKPGVYLIRYKHRGLGLPGSPIEETGGVIPVAHPGPGGTVQFSPIAPQEELRGNIDYGPVQLEVSTGQHHQLPFQLEEYQDDAHLAASQVLSQRTSARDVITGISGIHG